MPLCMSRLIFYVRDVAQLKSFYQTHFDLAVVEEIENEWVVFNAGGVELALHLVGKPYRDKPRRSDAQSNAKIVFQSFFMSTTVQPFTVASSSAWSSLPTLESRS